MRDRSLRHLERLIAGYIIHDADPDDLRDEICERLNSEPEMTSDAVIRDMAVISNDESEQ